MIHSALLVVDKDKALRRHARRMVGEIRGRVSIRSAARDGSDSEVTAGALRTAQVCVRFVISVKLAEPVS